MKKSLLFGLGFLCLTACGKQKFDIGKGDAEEELQKCTSLSQHKHYEQATECLEIFKSRFPQTRQGQEAELRIADNYFEQHQFLLAADAYQNFIKIHPASTRVDYAYYRSGLSYFRESPKAIDRDQKNLVKAAEQLELALRTTPQSTYYNEIVEALNVVHSRLAKRIYYIGHFYYRTGEYIAAIGRFNELVEKYPKSPLTAKTLYYLVRANLEESRQENARQAVENLVQNFPKDPWSSKGEKYFLSHIKNKS